MSETSASAPATPSTATPSTPASASADSATLKSTTTPPPAAAPEMFEVKVNGKTVNMTREEALGNASMSYAANDRFNEAKKLKADVDKIINTAKTNPIDALMDPALGLTKDQIRLAFERWYHQEYIEPETLNADQKKNREYEARIKKYEEAEALKKQQTEKEQEEKLTAQQRDYLQNQIVEAMEASGLPKTKFFASRMAFYMRQNLANGWEAPIDMIVKQVKNERTAMMSDMSQGATVEQLIGIFGDDVINKIRQHDLKQLREKRQVQPATGSTPNQSGTGVIQEKTYISDVTKRIRQARLGKL